MRFKARTDLERVYDTINDYSYGKVNKRIIYKQLRNLDLNIPFKLEKQREEEHYNEKKRMLKENSLKEYEYEEELGKEENTKNEFYKKFFF